MLWPAIVVLVESHHFLVTDALGGFMVLESTYNVGFWCTSCSGGVRGHWFGGVALAVDPR